MSTPEERAHADAVAQGLKDGLSADEALEYADAMRRSMWFQARAIGYAIGDAGRAMGAALTALLRKGDA